jgi:hypothetical protein
MSQTQDTENPDFSAAEMFLRQAREAHELGDQLKCLAARKLVAVALGLSEGPNGKLHTGHLARL